MNYNLIKEVIQLLEKFDTTIDPDSYSKDLNGFKRWICGGETAINHVNQEPEWEGKENGRSADSVINTLIVHMNRYAKTYSKSAIYNSGFSTQEDFIYLINLKAFGAMTKTDLIKKNIHEKPVGMQIINRLIHQGWVQQSDSLEDKRSKIIWITSSGKEELENSMERIRQASEIVSGDLDYDEKMQLIRLLQKLDDFHKPIYSRSLDPAQLIDMAYGQQLVANN